MSVLLRNGVSENRSLEVEIRLVVAIVTDETKIERGREPVRLLSVAATPKRHVHHAWSEIDNRVDHTTGMMRETLAEMSLARQSNLASDHYTPPFCEIVRPRTVSFYQIQNPHHKRNVTHTDSQPIQRLEFGFQIVHERGHLQRVAGDALT